MNVLVALRHWTLFGGRRRMAGPATGRVLELGIGAGSNLPYYQAAQAVVGVDPRLEALLLAREAAARDRPQAAESLARDDEIWDAGLQPGISLALVCAEGEALPFVDGSFDAVVTALVFCSVRDPLVALAEVRRVLRLGGELRSIEHVRPAHGPLRPLFRLLAPLWFRISHECEIDRDTVRTLEAAGFRIRSLREHADGVFVELIADDSHDRAPTNSNPSQRSS